MDHGQTRPTSLLLWVVTPGRSLVPWPGAAVSRCWSIAVPMALGLVLDAGPWVAVQPSPTWVPSVTRVQGGGTQGCSRLPCCHGNNRGRGWGDAVTQAACVLPLPPLPPGPSCRAGLTPDPPLG